MVHMKVCGIVGSPKKNGNVDLLVSQVLKGAESRGTQVCTLYLNDLHIRPCQSCGADPYPHHCRYDDDMGQIYDALESCDVIVLGSPVYFDTVSAQTKLVIDRCNCLMPYVERSDGTFGFERRIEKHKKGVFIAVAGTDQEFCTILATVKGFFHWANIELVETILYTHEGGFGCVREDKRTMEHAFEVGAAIVKQGQSYTMNST